MNDGDAASAFGIGMFIGFIIGAIVMGMTHDKTESIKELKQQAITDGVGEYVIVDEETGRTLFRFKSELVED
tara:strand:+ start:317 stop:532 length:216 start_codon:yes stop_codon:yes gene_type:complete